jgi:hypothetical protein
MQIKRSQPCPQPEWSSELIYRDVMIDTTFMTLAKTNRGFGAAHPNPLVKSELVDLEVKLSSALGQSFFVAMDRYFLAKFGHNATSVITRNIYRDLIHYVSHVIAGNTAAVSALEPVIKLLPKTIPLCEHPGKICTWLALVHD